MRDEDLHPVLDQLRERAMLAPGAAVDTREIFHGGPDRRRVLVLENGTPKLFLKLTPSQDNAEGLLREFQALLVVRACHRTGPLLANLPNPVFMGQVGDLWTLAMMALPGEPLGGALYPGGWRIMTRIRATAFLKVLPQVLSDLHTPLRLDATPPDIAVPPGLPPQAVAVAETSLAALREAPGPMGGTHGGFCGANILQDEDNAALIDWEAYHKEGVQVFDLFHLFTMAVFGPPPTRPEVAAKRAARWLMGRGATFQAMARGLADYAGGADTTAEVLGRLYPAYVCAMFWKSLEGEGPDAAQAWVHLLAYLAHVRPTLLTP